MAGTERTVTQPESGGNAGRKLKKLNRNPIAFTIISTVILTVYSLVIILPLIWAFYSSFKSELDFGFNPLGLPKEIFGGWQFENYAAAFRVLYIAVDNGCAVLDVTVEHPIYGQISGQLQVFSRYDADQFYHKLTTTNAPPLCALTGGVHLHTIQFQHEEDFERVVSRLREEGILFSE